MTKRAELIIIFSCAFIFFVCFFVHPIFPVQRYPLFADTPKQYETYHITTPEGMVLQPTVFKLQNTYDGDPSYLVGRLPTTVYRWGQVLSFSQLQEHFNSMKSDVLINFPTLCISRTIWGTLPDKSFGALEIDAFAWVGNQFTSDFGIIRNSCAFGVEQ